MIRGESLDMTPAHTRDADGNAVGAIIVTVRNPLAAASVALGIAELDEHIEQCQRLRASYTGPAKKLDVVSHMPDNLR
jgi:hypothetical protein